MNTYRIGGRIIEPAIVGTPGSSGPGAAGTTLFQQNVMSALGQLPPVAIPSASNAQGSAGIGTKMAWLTLQTADALSASTFALATDASVGAGNFALALKAFMYVRRTGAAVAGSNRSYEIRYNNGSLSNPMTPSLFTISWNSNLGAGTAQQTAFMQMAGFDTGSALPGTSFLGVGFNLVPTAGAIGASGGSCVVRFGLLYVVLPMAASSI